MTPALAPSRNRRSSRGPVAAILFAVAIAPSVAAAQGLAIYPANGQSPEQQQRDRYECHQWAIQQSGFDPSRPTVPVTTTAAPTAGPIRGAAGGAAVGAVGGAIGGNAGRGAAIGAGAGAVVGSARQRSQLNQQAANQNAALAAQQDAFSRAERSCLQGRGYTVN